MKEHAVNFTAEEVLATLTGRKTQARGVMKPQPEWRDGAWYWESPRYDNGDGVRYFHTRDLNGVMEAWLSCCPWQVGDILWVGETWGLELTGDYLAMTTGSCLVGEADLLWRAKAPMKVIYRADREQERVMWRPSVHMPRWACRLRLRVTDVRPERLQDITEANALADGGWKYANCPLHKAPRTSFAQAWDSRHANRGRGWDTNPWVWVRTYKRVEE